MLTAEKRKNQQLLLANPIVLANIVQCFEAGTEIVVSVTSSQTREH
ncbi:MAG: hypothetical protein ACFFD4_36370 [Candidatus Odinarchaeota archaeon]